MHLAVQFSKSVSKTTQVLIFGEFQSVIELDRCRAVFQMEINIMDNFQIGHILSTTKYVKDIFMGVYSVDTLPEDVNVYPSCYIINTDESTDTGEHWVCVYFNSNRQGEFFCSFANSPHLYDK